MSGELRALLIVAIAFVVLWLAFIAALLIAKRGAQARALATFVPDCLVLFKRLLGDPRVPRGRKVALALLAGYLAMPLDLVPDFIPIAGQADDAILVALVLRSLVHGAGAEIVREHWPGPEESLRVVLRLAGAPST